MISVENKILDHRKTVQKIQRIAFEIFERNHGAEDIIFAGIEGGGYTFAQMLQKEFNLVCDINNRLIRVTVDKNAPSQGHILLDAEPTDFENKVVILCDDVLHTGRTLAFCLKPFLTTRIQKLQVAVLVDRNHRSFPVSADYFGYELSTTINQHISVQIDKEPFAVYLY